VNEELETAKERSWREAAAIEGAYERGELGDEGWYEAMQALVVPGYLAADTPQGGSGSSRGTIGWERARSLLVATVEPGQMFLDVGCANGLLMESIARWAGIEPYGLELSPELAKLARRRLPQWANRIWVGNAIEWSPEGRFDVVRTGLEYVPRPRRPELIAHLLGFCDRLVIGVFNEERETRAQEEQVASWGYDIAGRIDREHPHPELAYRAFWIESG
jgi:2-polyprenyl-3-methyl-5-hydroxy-6-metoxy-1,4-benzoquinol methylase